MTGRGLMAYVERCGAVVKRRTRDREVPGSIPTNCKCCFLEQETLSTLLSTGFYPGKKRATWKISTKLLLLLLLLFIIIIIIISFSWKLNEDLGCYGNHKVP